MKKILLACCCAAFVLMSASAYAEIVLKLQTSTQSGAYEFKYINEEWGKRLKAMTGGEISLEFYSINSIVDRKETPEAVMAGVLGGDLTAVSYFTGRNPAFAILGDLIAGYDTVDQVQTYCRYGGGRDALQALWDATLPGAFHVVGCGAVAKEALVAKVPINGVDDFKGVKVRSPGGLAATVFKAAGAAPVSMSLSDVFTSLEKGVIDAADASAYINNHTSGFHQIAKYPIYPGIHSQRNRPTHQCTPADIFLLAGATPKGQSSSYTRNANRALHELLEIFQRFLPMLQKPVYGIYRALPGASQRL